MALPMNSGSEAVETAIKVMRKWGYMIKKVPKDKAEIIVCRNNFHGRTTTVISFSTDLQYRKDFDPLTPGFKVIDFGDAKQLEEAITENTVAFLVEPIQGEGGIIVPPDGYLSQVRKICTEHNVLMACDEIQTGLGRTGTLFAYEHDSDAKPDVLILGKALSGGFYPVSAVVASEEILGVFQPGDHGSTFGGNPLASAIASAALDVTIEEDLTKNSRELGAYLHTELRKISSRHIKEIRGRGLFVGIEIKESSGLARPFCEKLMTMGLLSKETHEQIIRLAPPLIITKEEVDIIIKTVRKLFEEAE